MVIGRSIGIAHLLMGQVNCAAYSRFPRRRRPHLESRQFVNVLCNLHDFNAEQDAAFAMDAAEFLCKLQGVILQLSKSNGPACHVQFALELVTSVCAVCSIQINN